MAYEFPVKNKFEAREVTELDFDIGNETADLYVDLHRERIQGDTDYLREIKYGLSLDDENRLSRQPQSYAKIIFSGHRGSGKTTELRGLHHFLDHPDRYFSIFIELEKETEVYNFQPEDLFIFLIAKLAEKVQEKNVLFESNELNDIVSDWLSETEVAKELNRTFNAGLGTEAGINVNIFSIVKLKAVLKSAFTAESKFSSVVRRKIRQNPSRLIERFNQALVDLRILIRNKGLGQDVLFIVDGSEKTRPEVFDQLFIKNYSLIEMLNVNAVFSVPITAYFDIERGPSQNFFQNHVLPMLKIKDPSATALPQVITRRIDPETFLEADALEYIVRMSGGCPRQLLRIVNRSLTIGAGRKIDRELAEKACLRLGGEMLDQLDSEHRDILLKGEFNTADVKVKELLFSLAVIKYNGDRAINPLIIQDVESLRESSG